MNKKEFDVILLAGGKGSRFKAKVPKQFVKLKKTTLIGWSIKKIANLDGVKNLIIGCDVQYQTKILKITKKIDASLSNKIIFCKSGKTRQESVFNALNCCTNETILLHESARPCASDKLFKEILNIKEINATAGENIPFTVLMHKNGKISSLLNRKELFNVQLPQKFSKEQLLEAHKLAKKEKIEFTDDSSLLFYYGHNVALVKGDADNIKITHPSDIHLASKILKRQLSKNN